MIILLTVLSTIVALIIGVIVALAILSPIRISIRRSQDDEIQIDIGRYMKNLWICIYLVSIVKVHLNRRGEVVHAHFIGSFFKASDKQIHALNNKSYTDRVKQRINEDYDRMLRFNEINDYF